MAKVLRGIVFQVGLLVIAFYPTEVVLGNDDIKILATECGFSLAGVAKPEPDLDFFRYQDWIEKRRHASMAYLADYRAEVRRDPRNLLASCQSVIVLGTLYNAPFLASDRWSQQDKGWISRYAWGNDYHDTIRGRMKKFAALLGEKHADFEFKICLDTAPLLERSYARQAGLGWIGKNTCLINQQSGSWFFLSELLTNLPLDTSLAPPDRCGSCTRCIDACPTQAIVATDDHYSIQSDLCISYWTIENRDLAPPSLRPQFENHLFGCDICQDVCPWNRRAPFTSAAEFQPRTGDTGLDLEQMAALDEVSFRAMFRPSPVSRTKYQGFLRNVAIAMGNSQQSKFSSQLERLSKSADAVVAQAAFWALTRLKTSAESL
jgi:epoxyqueuosine reductase